MPSSTMKSSQPPRTVVVTRQTPSVIASVTDSILCTLALSLATFAAQKELTPLFGSTPAKLHLYKTVVSAAILSAVTPKIRVRNASVAASAMLCAAPATLYWVAVAMSRLRDATFGPSLTLVLVLGPIIYLGIHVLRSAVSPLVKSAESVLLRITISSGACVAIRETQRLWTYLPPGRTFGASSLLISIGYIFVLIGDSAASNTTNAKPSSVRWLTRNRIPLFIAFGLSMLSITQPPTRSLRLPYTHPSGILRILSSTPSVTGKIIVGENFDHGFRYLRADHSLLGGVWIAEGKVVKMNKETPFAVDKDGMKLGDSIYSTFVLQEAVRLQETTKIQKNALVIGLGAGIAAQAFMQHGLTTSIIEIDPAVYSAARQYFGMGEPAAAYLEDARGWMARRTAFRNETFDIMVHDLFSGGGVPQQLFTLEFWRDTKAVLDPEGIVAVNFAGYVGGAPSKAILVTLQNSFGQCRVFHDYRTDATDDELKAEFINLVIFCTPSSDPLKFRKASTKDYLSSYLREHMLGALPDREISTSLITGGDLTPEEQAEWILTDERNQLGALQEVGAVDYWKVMRGVLPDVFWETY